jgi:hypothetical protein
LGLTNFKCLLWPFSLIPIDTPPLSCTIYIMLSAKLFTSVLPGKIQLKLVVFVVLFLLLSAVVTGFFIFNTPSDNEAAKIKAELAMAQKAYEESRVLPKSV